MSVRLKLEPYLDQCPKCWENFIEDWSSQHTNWDSHSKDEIQKLINVGLEKYRATYNKLSMFVILEEESDYLAFTLKYSSRA